MILFKVSLQALSRSQILSNFRFDYEDDGYEESDLVKVNCLVNRKIVPDLSLVCHRSKSQTIGKNLISVLKELISRQQFEVALQAAIGVHVIARDNIKAFRKDVTAKLVYIENSYFLVWW